MLWRIPMLQALPSATRSLCAGIRPSSNLTTLPLPLFTPLLRRDQESIFQWITQHSHAGIVISFPQRTDDKNSIISPAHLCLLEERSLINAGGSMSGALWNSTLVIPSISLTKGEGKTLGRVRAEQEWAICRGGIGKSLPECRRSLPSLQRRE